ncbi:MAG: efflux RND transporter permease subunit [Tannerella sp.]|jgi:multidrug efflux pump subunit AcrB|nr:efflux RND transporter permease subunit [Tannerella sp.]
MSGEKKNISSFTVIVAFVALSLAGLAMIPLLTVKLSPSLSLPSLTVSFRMYGSSARVVEMETTSKLEAMLSRINGIKNIRSTSSNGGGRITLEIDKYASMDMVRLEASTIVRQTWSSLPSTVSYPSIYVNMPSSENSRSFLSYNINAPAQPVVIQRYAEEYIKPALAQIKDIYKVDIYGAMPYEWLLEYDINSLDAFGVTVYDIRAAIEAYNQKTSLGMVLLENKGTDDRYIRLTLAMNGEQKNDRFETKDIYVKTQNGAMIGLDRLVTVQYREQEATQYFRINGLNSIYINLTASENANQIQLSKTVKAEMERLEKQLPDGYELHINYDAAEHINTELNKIYFRTFLTILILLLFVFFTTFSARYLLLIILSLFFNISIAFIFYYLFRLEIQMYSLAGITISLSLIIDNTIIMAEHYLRNHDYKDFLSLLAATLTSVGALSVIFFLNEKIRLNLQDFAAVVIINLLVSLVVALLFVPALIDRIKIKNKTLKLKHVNTKKIAVYFNRFYFGFIKFVVRFRVVAIILLILAFGLPVFMLPDKIEKESKFAEKYNKTVSSQTVKEKIRPVVEKIFGGTLRLFVQKTYNGSYFTRNDEKSLSITATMPNGTTMKLMNNTVQKMEAYLSKFKEIRQFQTNINSPYQARIYVLFTKEAEKTGFPYQLKSNVISQALQIGGGSWAVYGLEDQGFSNDVSEMAGNMRVKLSGYNYDDLYVHADALRNRLLTYRRIKEVLINSQYSWYKDNYVEYVFDLNLQRLASANITPSELYSSISPVFTRDMNSGYVVNKEQVENIKMSSVQSRAYDLWNLANMGRTVNGKYYKTGEFTTIEKGQTPQNIVKENQQYLLYLQYEYIGSYQQSNKKLEKELKDFNGQLPLGYSAENEGQNYYWSQKDNNQYLLIFLIILIIFFMSSILFNSLKQPLAIIFIIPVSYIGVFLTFYLFKLNFDQGGFASFVLLCAITVNSGIYIINEYNRIKKRKPLMKPIRAYIKAWNIKIFPIFLTVISTVLGFLPFMIGLDRESFWFPLAAGTIGGLIMSFVGIFLFLPVFLIKKKFSRML